MPSRRLVCNAALVACVVGSIVGCGGAQVEIALSKSDALAIAPEFVRFVFLHRGDDIEAGPFGVRAITAESFAAIPPNTPFSVDVIGCLSNVRDACEEPDSFVGRGCAGPFTRQREQALQIDVELLPTAEGNALCPIAPE